MEKWMPVVGLENFYEVSNLGNIKSLIRQGKTNYGIRNYGGKILKPFIGKIGYPVVNLTLKNYRKQYLIHRLVLEAFCGSPLNNMEGCHNDGNKENCKLENLRWDTRSNNALDRRNHITWQGGENSKLAKLTKQQASEIKYSKESLKTLAKKYNVGTTTISRIKNNKSWIHI